MALSAGTRLGSYEILAPLGSGGMGEVYRAHDTRLGRDVAIKILTAQTATESERLQRFDREARTTAALSHPNIVTIHAIEQLDDVLCIVMELVEGRPLTEAIPKGGLPLDRFFELAIQIADALSAAHEKGITHRDLKPANVMVTADGRVKVLDFGLAKLGDMVAAPAAGAALPTMAITGQGQILGTVAYMSPEQAQGATVDPRSDLFSAGIVLFEMATGERPFKGDNSVSVLSAILKDTPVSVTDLKRDIPPELSRLIRRCLEKDPGRRIQTARDLRNELQDLKDEFVTRHTIDRRASTTIASPASRRPLWPAAAAAALIVLSIGAIVLWRGLSSTRTAGAGPIDSVVVLPFANASGNPDSEYLSDGITDSVINSLAKLGKVRVVPRGVAFSYKGKMTDLQAVARALNVRAVVTGRVSERGGTLVVGAELMDVATVSQTWGDQYTRKMEDIFALQDDVARDIAKGLRLKLAGNDELRLAKRTTTDAEAYRLFMRGRFELDKWTPAGWKATITFDQQAIDRDPAFVHARLDLAAAYVLLAFSSVLPPDVAYPRARSEKDVDAGAGPLDTLGQVYLRMGKLVEAEAAFTRYTELTNIPRPGLAAVYVKTGRRAEAERMLQDVTARAEQGRLAPLVAAEFCAVLSRVDDAFRWLDKALAVRDVNLLIRRFAFLLDGLHGDPRWADLERRIAAVGPRK